MNPSPVWFLFSTSRQDQHFSASILPSVRYWKLLVPAVVGLWSLVTERRWALLPYHCLSLNLTPSFKLYIYSATLIDVTDDFFTVTEMQFSKLNKRVGVLALSRCHAAHFINRFEMFQMVLIESGHQHLVLNAAQVRSPLLGRWCGHDGTQPNGRGYDVRLGEWPTPYISWALSGLICGLCTWYSHRFAELQSLFHWHSWLAEWNWQPGRKRSIKNHNKIGASSLFTLGKLNLSVTIKL